MKNLALKSQEQEKVTTKKTQEDALILWQNGINSPEFRENLKNWQKEAQKRLEKNQWRYRQE
jgi:flagellar motor component MotA